MTCVEYICVGMEASESVHTFCPCSGNFKFKGQQRVFIKECTSSSQDVTDGPGPSQSLSSSSGHGSKIKEPLKGFKVYVIGRLSQSKPVLTRQIESLGGKVVSKVNENTTICISNESKCGGQGSIGR